MSTEIMKAGMKANLWEECLIDFLLNKWESSPITGRCFGFWFVSGPQDLSSQKKFPEPKLNETIFAPFPQIYMHAGEEWQENEDEHGSEVF